MISSVTAITPVEEFGCGNRVLPILNEGWLHSLSRSHALISLHGSLCRTLHLDAERQRENTFLIGVGVAMERNILISLLVVVAACSCPANAIAAQFKAAKYYHTGQDPYQAVTADFNHDGNTDIAFADWLSNQVVVVLGKGDGTFQKPHIFSLGSAGALVSGDLNEDGNTDLAVAQFGGTGH